MTTFRSKIGLELVIPVSIIVGGTGIVMAYEKIWFGLAIVFLVIAFIIHMFLTTYYQIDNNTLRIKCGLFYEKSVSIDSIRDISETRNPINSPATSLDRIVIRYNKFDTVIISPKDKRAFVHHLTSINPCIKLSFTDGNKQSVKGPAIGQ